MESNECCVEVVFESGDCLTLHFFDISSFYDKVYDCLDFKRASLEDCDGEFSGSYRAIINWEKVCYVREINCERSDCDDYKRACETPSEKDEKKKKK